MALGISANAARLRLGAVPAGGSAAAESADPPAGLAAHTTDDPPTDQTRIVEPAPGMVVLSVLGPNGEWDSVDPFTDTLLVEVMTSREARGRLDR